MYVSHIYLNYLPWLETRIIPRLLLALLGVSTVASTNLFRDTFICFWIQVKVSFIKNKIVSTLCITVHES